MSPTQWIKRTNSIGIISKGGRYSIGTFAHPDIAFEFASWLSPEFKLYLITEFERLKINEAYQNKIEWSVKRELIIWSRKAELNRRPTGYESVALPTEL